MAFLGLALLTLSKDNLYKMLGCKSILMFLSVGMPPAVFQGRGLHLPCLQTRPGQELLHVCQQRSAGHSKSAFPRLQQWAMIITPVYSALKEAQ